jgi:hypothetical protein
MRARGWWPAVLVALAGGMAATGCGRSVPQSGSSADDGTWLLEVNVGWDPSLTRQGVEVRWNAGPASAASDTSAQLSQHFASSSQSLAFASQLQITVGGKAVASELVTGDACSGVVALGQELADYRVVSVSRSVDAHGVVTSGPTLCQRRPGPSGLEVDDHQRTLRYVVRKLSSPLAGTFADAPLVPRSIKLEGGAGDVELVVLTPYSAPAATVRGALQISLGGEAAGAVTASYDACLAQAEIGAGVALQSQDLLVNGGGVSAAGSLLCCTQDSCLGVVP